MSSSAKVGLYDTHCHLEGYWDEALFAQLLSDARAVGFLDAVTCPHDATRFGEHVDFCRKFDLSFALGVHPFEWSEAQTHLSSLETFLHTYSDEAVAIGEIGLDFSEMRRLEFWPDSDPETMRVAQTELFETQLEIARDLDLPVSVHAFASMNEVERSIKKFKGLRGVIHAFNGSVEQAIQFARIGFKVGFGGTLTYPGSKKIRRVFSELPDSAWVLETDAPWIPSFERRAASVGLAPETIQSVPADIDFTVKAAAQLRRTSCEDVIETAYRNTREIFPKLRAV
ncbi:MAG: TatD family hydrolase [Sutterellaceae bacterium]|nr:TatD family hydrolase [Sutterellaceae bacterium]